MSYIYPAVLGLKASIFLRSESIGLPLLSISPGLRSFDSFSLASDLSAKLEWIEALPDDDHVARMRVRNLWSTEGRMDEVVAEIAMGRSIVEG